jgi:hypothetical protein
MIKVYKYPIKKLRLNDVFVFGSNTEGRHGAGAAKWAFDNAGAVWGLSRGMVNSCYAIETKDLSIGYRSVSKQIISAQIKIFYSTARRNSHLRFYVAYTGGGRNLNGYLPTEMAELFSVEKPPLNVYFENKFAKLIHKCLN